MIAYHFVDKTLRDGSPIPADGVWLEYSGPLIMCKSGLHASKHAFDALTYAPGETLCLVEVAGDIQEQSDKLVCRRRCILARFDATDLLRQFARECALSVIHLWDAPSIVREYLESGDESKREAARVAARDAANAARAAAWDAARAAACAAAWAAAWVAAWVAARAAANAAAKDAKAAEVETAQRQRFKALVNARFAEMGKLLQEGK